MYQLFVIIESDIYSISTKYQVDRPGIEKIDLRLLHHCQKRLAKILRFLVSYHEGSHIISNQKED